MADNIKKFKVPLISPAGEPVISGTWSLVKGGEAYHGTIHPEDSLIQVLQLMDRSESGKKLTDEQIELFRSFLCAITQVKSPQTNLFEVFDLGLPLSRSADYIWRIGMFDRAANAVVGVAGVATHLWLAIASFHITPIVGASMVSSLGIDVAASFLSDVDARLGDPGNAVGRSEFEAETLLHMLRLFRIRHLISVAKFDPSVEKQISKILDSQILRLFIINSRQISGLALAGAAEASSAVVAHSLIALTLSNSSDREEILSMLETNVSGLAQNHRQETLDTLSGIRETISKQDVQTIERQLNRYLISSSAAEAMDLAVQPVRLVFDMFGSISNGLGSVVGGGSPTGKGNLFQTVGEQLKTVSSAVDLTPDMAAKALNSQFAVESWTRNQIADLWGVVWRSPKKDA